MENTSVTAAEFVRHFASYREASRSAPIFITHHGRETHVLSSVSEYRDMKARVADEGSDPRARGEGLAFALADWIDEALIICDSEMRVTFVNRVAQAIVRHAARQMVGERLFDVLPALSGSLMEVHARRTMIGSEPSAADIPSPFHANAWLRFQSFPLGDQVVLKFRDITEDVQRHRLADVKQAILRAMSVHGGIGYVRISLRGTIDRVDEPFCEMLDLPEHRLEGVMLSDLVAMADKPRFRSTLEDVLRTAEPARGTFRFLSNRGDLICATVAIVQLHGAYGAEGAVVLLTDEEARMQDADKAA